MGTVSFEVPGPGTYNVTCDPKLDPLANSGTAGDILSGKQFYNDQNTPMTGTMPNNPPQQVSVAGGESYTIPKGYHDGTGKVSGTGTVLPALTNPGTAGDLLKDKELLDGSGNIVTGTLVPGSDTQDATATAADILAPKTAYIAAGKVTGTISTKGNADVTADGPTVAVPPGYYPQAVNKTVSDPGLIPGNIKAGVDIFGVTGTLTSSFAAVLVVTVDSGATVTATDGTTTLTATSNGTATFHLPNGGTWTVSATLNGSQSSQATVEVQENFNVALSAGASQTVMIPTQYEAELNFVQTYTVTLSVDPAGSGTVTGAGEYQEGTQATVTAIQADGYEFAAWKEAGVTVSTDNPYTFTVTGDRTLVAEFHAAVKELVYYGRATGLSVSRYDLAAAGGNGHALFAGGITAPGGDNCSAVVDAYDENLSHTTPTSLSQARHSLASAVIEDYILFGGGTPLSTIGNYSSVVDAYDKILTHTTPTALSIARVSLSGASSSDYALFGGGKNGGGATFTSVVDAYNTSLTRTNATPLSSARDDMATTTVGEYALFAGGYNNSNVVDAYDDSLTRTTPTGLSVGRKYPGATTVGNFGLFGGGTATSVSAVIDAYDSTLTRTTPQPLSSARQSPAAANIVDYALFAGGDPRSDVVDAYDASLARTTPTPLSSLRSSLAGAAVGNYALFGGGRIINASYVVDAYTLQ